MAEASMRDGGNGYIIIKFIYLKILEIRGKPEKKSSDYHSVFWAFAHDFLKRSSFNSIYDLIVCFSLCNLIFILSPPLYPHGITWAL